MTPEQAQWLRRCPDADGDCTNEQTAAELNRATARAIVADMQTASDLYALAEAGLRIDMQNVFYHREPDAIKVSPAPQEYHCPACSMGQSLEKGEGTHILATVEHPEVLPVLGRDTETTVAVPAAPTPPTKPPVKRLNYTTWVVVILIVLWEMAAIWNLAGGTPHA